MAHDAHSHHDHGHGDAAAEATSGERVRVVKVNRRPMGVWEKAYLPEIIRGLGVTMRHFFKNLFSSRDSERSAIETVDYPSLNPSKQVAEQEDEDYFKRHYPQRFRGAHRLMRRSDDRVRCTACMLCATACPAQCIHIVAGESDDHHIEKFAVEYDIDYLKCIFCGFCVEACPCDAIRMDTGHHTQPFLARSPALLAKTSLMERTDASIAVHGGTHKGLKSYGPGEHGVDPSEVPLEKQPEGPTFGPPNSPGLRRQV